MMQVLLMSLLPAILLVISNRLSRPKLKQAPQSLWIGDAVALLSGSLITVVLIGFSQRVGCSIALVVLLVVLLFAGNRLKIALLGETLVFSDIFLAGHAICYPRLYFGYAPVWIWPTLLLALLAWVFLFAYETPLSLGMQERILTVVGLVSVLMGFIVWIQRKIQKDNHAWSLMFDAQKDAAAFTPLGAALLHSLWHAEHRQNLKCLYCDSLAEAEVADKKISTPMKKPHLMLIQAESFCDLAELTGRDSVMPTLDQLRTQGVTGAFNLAWQGAYTMRSEFAVLTGVAPQSLQTYAFDPYQMASAIAMPSLARQLKAQGYKTVVWHPNDGRFFNRTQVMKNFGFDEFLDIADFKDLPINGRYISDEALLTKAAEYLKNTQTPTFLFVITMEAHGPWDAGKFPESEPLSENQRYEKHLISLDRGLASLSRSIQNQDLNAELFLYGDHQPGLKSLREKRQPGSTSQTLWLALGQRFHPKRLDIEPQQLPNIILTGMSHD